MRSVANRDLELDEARILEALCALTALVDELELEDPSPARVYYRVRRGRAALQAILRPSRLQKPRPRYAKPARDDA